MLTPEREKEIREGYKNFDFVNSTFCEQAIPELLAEIDRLRSALKACVCEEYLTMPIEIERLKENNAQLRHEFKMAQASMPEVKLLREKIELATEALNFYATNDIRTSNFNYRDNGTIAKQALNRIRGI